MLKFEKVAATVPLLRETLTHGTRILHFCGHGIPRSLVFEHDSKLGVASRVSADSLQYTTQPSGGDGVDLVFISASHSENVGKAFIRAGAKHVIAIRQDEQLHDQTDASFAEQFYVSLVQGKSVRHAFTVAKQTLAVKHRGNTYLEFEHMKYIILPKDTNRIGIHDVIMFPRNYSTSDNILAPKTGRHFPQSLDSNGNPIGGYVDNTRLCLKKFRLPPNSFIGKKRVATVVQALNLVNSRRLTVLTGKKWVGKTALVNKISDFLFQRNKFDGIFVFNHFRLIINDPNHTLAYVLSKTMRQFGNAKDVIPAQYVDTNEEFANRLSQDDKRYLLVFENIDEYSFDLFRSDQRLDKLLSVIIKQCVKVNVLITMSTGVNRLDFLNEIARSNDIQLNTSALSPLDVKESTRLIEARLSQTSLTLEEQAKVNKEKVVAQCRGLPGLINFGVQLYINNRNDLDNDNVLKTIDDAIIEERRKCNNTTYYKSIQLDNDSENEIDEDDINKSDILTDYAINARLVEESFAQCSLENSFQSVDLLFDKHSCSKSAPISDLYSRYSKNNKFSKRFKKLVQAIWNAFRRSISFIDLFTDCRLLYLIGTSNISDSDSKDSILAFVALSMICIACPYIVSYSCGIKLLFIHRDYTYDIKNLRKSNGNSYDGYVAFKKLIVYLTLSPFGVIYYVILDLVDMIFVYYKLLEMLLFGKSELEIKLLEETVANQLHMSRMDYEGIKRQRSTAQWIFETIPQSATQLFLLLGIFGSGSLIKSANISLADVVVSICFAVLNGFFQVFRLKLESQACNESFSEYCLECLMARISWIPFEKEIQRFLLGNTVAASDNNIATTKENYNFKTINYNIKYSYPCWLSQIVNYKPKLEFDFSSLTIQKLMNTLQLSDISSTSDNARKKLEINFGGSLRLLNFQDVMNLFEMCYKRGILIAGFENHNSSQNSVEIGQLLFNAANISADAGKDARLLSNCRNSAGKPFHSGMVASLNTLTGNTDGTLSTVLECLILHDFDMNAVDYSNGETVVFDLIRENKVKEYLLLLQKFVQEKQNRLMINYYNKSGISPLYLAIQNSSESEENSDNNVSEDELKIQNEENDNSNEIGQAMNMYQVLIDNSIEEASVNFPAFESGGVVRSNLGAALLAKKWGVVDKLITNGAVLNTTEISILVETYLDLVAKWDKNDVIGAKYYSILARALKKCNLSLQSLIKGNGDNPLHQLTQTFKIKLKSQSKIIYDKKKDEEKKNRDNFMDDGKSVDNDPNWLFMENGSTGYTEYTTSFSRLVDIYPNWLFMENGNQKLAIEFMFEMIFDMENNFTNFALVGVLHQCLTYLEKSHSVLFQRLVKRRLEEYPSIVECLRLLLLVTSSMKNNDLGFMNCVHVLTMFEDIIFDTSGMNADQYILVKAKQLSPYPYKNIDPNQVKSLVNTIFKKKHNVFINVEIDENDDDDDDDGLKEYDDVKVDLYDQINDNLVDEQEINDNGDEDIGAVSLSDNDENVIDGDSDVKVEIEQELKKQDENEREALSWIEWIYILSVEALSCADFVTDIIVLIELIRASEIWWSTFSILFMVSPYLVSYTATGSMLKKKSHFLSLLVMTPLFLIYFMILDIVFMVYAILSSIVFLFTCSKIDIGDWMEEHFFHTILGVSRMELIGYRRLRMLSQLLFESFPSLVLQIRILYVINNDDSNNYSETYDSLYFSIGFALIHTFMEGCILYLDSKACHSTLYQYAIVCLNARLSWVPFANILTLKSVSREYFLKNNYSYNMPDFSEYTKLNFEQIVSSLGCVKYKLDYEFGNDSWQILIKHINNMVSYCPFRPVNSNIDDSINYKTTNINVNANTLIAPLLTASSDAFSINTSGQNKIYSLMPQIMQIELGKKCCKNIDLFELYQLLQVSSNKLILKFGNIDWKRMILITRFKYNDSETLIALNQIRRSLVSVADFSALAQFDSQYFEYISVKVDTVSNININDETVKILQSMKCNIVSHGRFDILPLKRCYDMGIMYGTTCSESNALYSIVFGLLKNELANLNQTETRNYSYKSTFENGQRFHTAMLLLLYTQRTIKKHHCYQCGKNWISHICELGSMLNIKSNANYNNMTKNDKDQLQTLVAHMIDEYLPQSIDIVTSPKIDDKWRVAIDMIDVCDGLNKIFSEYLLRQAYSYSLAGVAFVDGADRDALNSLLMQLKGKQELVMQLSNRNYDNDNDDQVSNIAKIYHLNEKFGTNLFNLEGLLSRSLYEQIQVVLSQESGSIPIVEQKNSIMVKCEFGVGNKIAELTVLYFYLVMRLVLFCNL